MMSRGLIEASVKVLASDWRMRKFSAVMSRGLIEAFARRRAERHP